MPGMAPCLLLGELESIYKPPFPPPCSAPPGQADTACPAACRAAPADSRITDTFRLENTFKMLKSSLWTHSIPRGWTHTSLCAALTVPQ